MCGFCGFTGNKNVDLLKSMTTPLLHRGPDDEGYYYDGEINLGFRRLSIIDLEKGHQPMTNYEKDVVIVFNGAIYNYRDLKSELKRDGYRFINNSDTEVIIQLYKKYGLTFVEKLNGMYSIALYDIKKRRLFLISDRFLKKPLFYYLNPANKELIFASEIKSILKYSGIKKEINYEALHHYLTFKHIPRPHTIYNGIKSLIPAEIITYDFQNKNISKKKYWDIDYGDEYKDITENEASEKFLELFEDSVKMRLVADVEVGAYLSGGLDSSGILSIMSKYYDKKIKTFSMVYSDSNTDTSLFNKQSDVHFARLMSKKYNTEHFEIKANLMNVPNDIHKIINCVDEPFSAVFTYYYLSEHANNHLKVILCGDGGDEHFGSYYSHRLAYPVYHYNKLDKPIGEITEEDKLLFGKFDLDYIDTVAEKNEWDWRIKLNVWGENEKRNLYSTETLNNLETLSTINWYKNEFSKCKSTTPLNRMLEMELKTKFSNEMTMLVDRYNMAHSLECRCPFIDYKLMEFTARIPDRLKMANGENKYIYKLAMKKLLPDEIQNRNKEGLIMPIYDLILEKWEKWTHQVLSKKNIEKYNIFDYSKINDFMLNKKQFKPYHYAQKVWNLMILQIWLDDNFS
ncbi:MAG: asparagine synthase (glutamine-hydrolyzing) [Maribacter sp.]|nr:asparagine synthase (glutamine-hydrolyzing) [Candidatus Brocadiaceae bacterium]MCP4978490.1 asparagine synthase (glutamine-hydrolyzing) [Maribacter sp.]